MKKEIKFYSIILATTVICSINASAEELAQLSAKEFAKKAKIVCELIGSSDKKIRCEGTVYKEVTDDAIKLELAKEALRVVNLNSSARLDDSTAALIADQIPNIERESLEQIKIVADVVKKVVKSDAEFNLFNRNPILYLKNNGLSNDFEIYPSYFLDLETLSRDIKKNRIEIVDGVNGPGVDGKGIWIRDACEERIINQQTSTSRKLDDVWGPDKIFTGNDTSRTGEKQKEVSGGISNTCPEKKVIMNLIKKNLRLSEKVSPAMAKKAFDSSSFVSVSIKE